MCVCIRGVTNTLGGEYDTYHECKATREREMFYLTTHSTHFIYGYMASDIWLRTILIERKSAATT